MNNSNSNAKFVRYIANFLLLIGLCSKLSGQVAVIQDKDGYTNVRTEPNSKSKIVYQIKTDEVFWVDEDYYDESLKWCTVYIPKNKFSVGCEWPIYVKGFVHKSRVQPFNERTTYQGNELIFKYQIGSFEPQKDIIGYEGNSVASINGQKFWGTDGGLPHKKVEDLSITLNGNKISVPKVLLQDIFECDNDFEIHKIDDTYFVHQWNSDGAGAYEIVWVIDKDGIKQRLVGSII